MSTHRTAITAVPAIVVLVLVVLMLGRAHERARQAPDGPSAPSAPTLEQARDSVRDQLQQAIVTSERVTVTGYSRDHFGSG